LKKYSVEELGEGVVGRREEVDIRKGSAFASDDLH
jgi:hypothetical protein